MNFFLVVVLVLLRVGVTLLFLILGDKEFLMAAELKTFVFLDLSGESELPELEKVDIFGKLSCPSTNFTYSDYAMKPF